MGKMQIKNNLNDINIKDTVILCVIALIFIITIFLYNTKNKFASEAHFKNDTFIKNFINSKTVK